MSQTPGQARSVSNHRLRSPNLGGHGQVQLKEAQGEAHIFSIIVNSKTPGFRIEVSIPLQVTETTADQNPNGPARKLQSAG